MFEFIKHIIKFREKLLTILVMEEDKPDMPDIFTFRPKVLFTLVSYVVVFLLALTFLVLTVTPIGALLFDKEDVDVKRDVVMLAKRVNDLRDSLLLRDSQLYNIKSILYQENDTTFQLDDYMGLRNQFIDLSKNELIFNEKDYSLDNFEMINTNEMINSRLLKASPKFPAPWPLEGTKTKEFNADEEHFGLDIAAKEGTFVRSIANGVIVTADWTMNYGYILHIQHADGYISVYKHCSNVFKKEGNIIIKGDILGTIGKSGLLTSGPHLHLELWRDGTALDPALYLIKK